jgi:hypothetical protein
MMPKISLPPTNDRLLTRLAYALVGICLAFSLAPDLRAQSAADEGPAKETAVAIEKCSVKNFGKVNDRLFRGGQPTSLNYQELARLGIKTILDLREDAETFAAPGAEAAGLKYINLRLNAKRPPTREESEQFLRIIKDDANGPVFITAPAAGIAPASSWRSIGWRSTAGTPDKPIRKCSITIFTPPGATGR